MGSTAKNTKTRRIKLKLTLVIDASPAVGSWVSAQTLVLFRSDVFGPLQDRNVFQKFPFKLGVCDLTSDGFRAFLQEADNTATLLSKHIKRLICSPLHSQGLSSNMQFDRCKDRIVCSSCQFSQPQ